MNYVFVTEEDDKNTHIITSLSDVSDTFDITVNDRLDGMPCYYLHMTGVGGQDTDVSITSLLDFIIEQCCHVYGADQLLGFSVTSQERRAGDWLDAAARYPKAQVQEVRRGNRTCYFVTIPVSDKPLV